MGRRCFEIKCYKRTPLTPIDETDALKTMELLDEIVTLSNDRPIRLPDHDDLNGLQ